MFEWLSNSWGSITGMLGMVTVTDVIDIACVAVMLYYIYKFIRDRRAGKLAAGVIFCIVFLAAAELLGMHAMQFILTNVFQVGMITLVILFQPELRSALEKMGGQSIRGLKSLSEPKNGKHTLEMIEIISETASDLSASKTGALMVIERTTRLGDQILTGTIINADIEKHLIENIFYNKAPLHDGALIIRDGRLFAAGCFLPPTMKSDIAKELGTRHRAAIGMSENSDAVVVVVSEETGAISVAVDGRLYRPFTGDTLKIKLTELLIEQEDTGVIKKNVMRVRGIFKQSGVKKADKKSDDSGNSGGGDLT